MTEIVQYIALANSCIVTVGLLFICFRLTGALDKALERQQQSGVAVPAMPDKTAGSSAPAGVSPILPAPVKAAEPKTAGTGGGAVSPPSPIPTPVATTDVHPIVVDDAFQAFIMAVEGFSATAYGDFKQYSIGYGTKAKSPDEVITRDEAKARMITELNEAAQIVERFIPNAPIGVKQGMSSLTYNAGPVWEKAGLGALLAQGNWGSVTLNPDGTVQHSDGAAAHLLQYNHAGGKINDGLTTRRIKEAQMFTNPL